MTPRWTLAIHGGAGTISPSAMTPEKESAYRQGLNDALLAGEEILREGGHALDAVQKAVSVLEDCPMFNAGKGSVFTHEGHHEMDAAIMEGATLQAGAVAGVRLVRNPILLAREVMENSEHVLLSGSGAEEFARMRGLAFESEAYFFDAWRHSQWQEAVRAGEVRMDHSDEKKFGTVGAVARDSNGHVAAATSTGGMTNKRWGRIGDSPVIGSGTYANDNTCAISCTGHGEYFLRAVVAYDISCLMEYKGFTLEEACRHVVQNKLVQFGGEGGLVAVDARGNYALPYNSEGMYRGVVTSEGERFTRIWKH